MTEVHGRDLLHQAEQERLGRETLSSSHRQHIRPFKFILAGGFYLVSY